jgi:F-type H+-transporting ATPase subunit b
MHIDWWTLALQTVNALVLIWILTRFFFRPVMNIIAKRQSEVNKVMADADAVRRQAADARAEADRARAEIGAERDRLIAEAEASARKEKASLLAQSSLEIAKLRSDAETSIARDRMAADQATITRASELSVDIARRLLGRLPTAAVLSAFLDGLCGALRGLSSEAREGFTSAPAAGHAIEIVTAEALSKEGTRQVGDALEAVFGSKLPFTFCTDPALIAGIELHSRNVIVSNSWQADLECIRKELGRDEPARSS